MKKIAFTSLITFIAISFGVHCNDSANGEDAGHDAAGWDGHYPVLHPGLFTFRPFQGLKHTT
jgi:hypothetical protein